MEAIPAPGRRGSGVQIAPTRPIESKRCRLFRNPTPAEIQTLIGRGEEVDFVRKPVSAEDLKRKLERYAPGAGSVVELTRRVDELTCLNETLREFCWAASHDLREPLRNILACAERLERSAEQKLDVDLRAAVR